MRSLRRSAMLNFAGQQRMESNHCLAIDLQRVGGLITAAHLTYTAECFFQSARLDTLQIVSQRQYSSRNDVSSRLWIDPPIGERLNHEVLAPNRHVTIAMSDYF